MIFDEANNQFKSYFSYPSSIFAFDNSPKKMLSNLPPNFYAAKSYTQ